MASPLQGASQVASAIRQAIKEGSKRAEAALYQEGLKVERLSRSLTPVDLGPLRASHDTTRPKMVGGQLQVHVVVGGSSAPYALHVHENLDAHHDVGQAKFLEHAVLALRDEIPRNIANAMRLKG